jgi:mannose-6-phosphate isomerase
MDRQETSFPEERDILVAISSPSTPSAWAPFRIAPWFSERPWGWRDLHPWYDRVAGDGEPGSPATGLGRRGGEAIGEAWLTGDQCVVATGAHAGKTLGALFAEAPESLLGSSAPCGSESAAPSSESAPRSASPLLIKVIFAKEKLSVQVHPDDAMAQKYGDPRGKTECWYVLEAEQGAQVALGLKQGVTLDDLKAGIDAGTLESSLKLLDLTPGEMIFVDAGTVHAIWPGSVLLETQQNCDLTYRMYDYGRGRELHIQKSLEATRLKTRAGVISPQTLPDRTLLMDGEYFRVERIHVAGSRTSASLNGPALPDEANRAPGLQYLFAAAGAAIFAGPGFEAVELSKGGMVAVPAAAPEFVLEDLGGLNLIRITPRWPEPVR